MQASLVLAFAAIGQALEFSEISLTVPDEFASENGGSVQFGPLLDYSGPYDGSLWTTRSASPKFRYNTKDGSAKAGSDYVQSTGVFSFANSGKGQSESVSIPIVNDNIAEPSSEYFELEVSLDSLSNPEFGAITLPATNAKATISDDEGLSIKLVSASATEGVDTKFDFSVVLSHKTADDFNFLYTTINGQSAQRTDYTHASQVPLIFAAGTQSKTFSIAITDDNIQEDIETFEVYVEYDQGTNPDYRFNWVSYESSGQRALGKFEREDEGVTVCISNQIIAEGADSSMTFKVSLSHVVETDIPLTVTTQPGSSDGINHAAAVATHYLAAQDTLSFPAKSTDDLSFNVPILNDNVQSPHSSSTPHADFGPVNFGVQYTVDASVYAGSTGGATNAWNVRPCGSTSNMGVATGEIYDHEDVTLSLSSSASELVEGSSTTWQYTVSLSHKVVASLESGSSARGASFVWVDSNAHVDGVAQVEVNAPVSGCSTLPNYGNPEMPSSGPVDVCWPQGINPMNKNNGKPQNAVPTEQTFNSAPGVTPTDFFATFAHGPVDHFIEGTETFRVGVKLESTSELYNIRYADGLTVEDGVVYLDASIADDEPTSPFTFTSSGSSIAEFDGAQFSFSVALSHSCARDVSLSWSANSGSAVEATDFQETGKTVLTWPAASAPNQIRTAEVLVLNDNIQEQSETFTVSFFNAEPSALFAGVSNDLTATITDDEDTTISIADMAEAQDESATVWDFAVSLSHNTDHDILVSYAAAVDTSLSDGVRAEASRLYLDNLNLLIPANTKNVVAGVSVKNDDIQTGTADSVQLFNVVLDISSASSISATGSKLSATGRISDNEGVVASIANTFGQEADGQSTFIVSLSHAVTTDVTVLYTSDETTCQTGATDCAIGSSQGLSILQGENDYASTGAASTVTVLAGTKTKELVIALNDDTVQEFTETFGVTLDSIIAPVANSFSVSTTHGKATATIYDDEGVKVEVGDAKASEGQQLTFTVKMTKTVNADVTVNYKVTSGSAVFGNDFETVPQTPDGTGTITINKGQKEATVNVLAVDDQIAEQAETFNIQITSITVPNLEASIIPANQVGTGTIGSAASFDEGLTVEITTDAATTNRPDSVVFKVKLSHQVSSNINIDYSTEDGSATSGGTHPDFSATSGTARFKAMGSTEHSVSVPTLVGTCQQKQLDETFSVKVVASTGLAHNNVLTATATIAPVNHNPTVTIQDASSNEGTDMAFSVSLSHCVTEEVHLAFNSMNGQGSAYPGQQFLLPSLRTFSFPADSVVPTVATFGIQVMNDDVQGEDRDFKVKISAANPPNDNANDFSIVFASEQATGLIRDDEYPTLSVTQCVSQDPSVNDQFVFTVALSHAVGSTIELAYNTTDYTAIAGQDYLATQGTIQFPQGTKASHEITVEAIARPDVVQPHGTSLVPPPAHFGLNLETSGQQSVLDTFKVSWGKGDGNTPDNVGKGAIKGKQNTNLLLKRVTGTEGDVVELTAIIEDTLSADVTLSYEITSGGDDAFVTGSNIIVFAANQPPNQEQKFSIELTDDFVVEPRESFDVEFTVVSPAGFQGTVINFDGVEQGHEIIDNDHATLAVLDASSSESNQLDVASNIVFTVVLSHYTYQDIVVDFVPSSVCGGIGSACIVASQPASQSATADLVYTPSNVKSLTFTGGQTTGRTAGGHVKEIVFDILNDNILEPTETFTLSATSASSLLGTDSIMQATGSILDDEGASFIVTTDPVLEGDDANFAVRLSHEVSTSVTVNFATTNTILSDLYFESKVGSFSISTGSPEANFFIKTVDNSVLDPVDVLFDVDFTATVPFMQLSGAKATGTIENDTEDVRVVVTCQPVDENAAQPTLVFANTLRGGSTATAFNVAYTTKDIPDEAVAGVDYEATSGTMSFNGAEFQRVTVAVPVLKDDLVENDELVGFEIEVVEQAYRGRIATETVSGKIVDLEDATMTIRDAVVREAENAQMTFTVYLSHEVGTNTDFQLEYNAFSDAADDAAWSASKIMASGERAGKDYDAVTGAVSDRLSGSRGQFYVNVHDDFITELAEFVQVEITKVPEKFSIANPLAVGSIVDDDVATVSINSVSSHLETVSTVELQVTMSHLTQERITVSYQTLDGFATSALEPAFFKNEDYKSKSGTVVFPSAFPSVVQAGTGEDTRTQTISIEVVDDIIVEEDYEDFCVSLRNVVTPANIGAIISPDARDGFVALRDDAEAATVYVVDVTGQEGATLEFQVVLSHAVQGSDVTVNYETRDITTTADVDYVTTTGSSIFRASVIDGPKQADDTILVDTIDDSEDEFNEVFEIQLLDLAVTPGIVGDVALSEDTLSIAPKCGHGTIEDTKGALALGALSIHDASAEESTDSEMTFFVRFPRDRDSFAGDVGFTYRTFAGNAIPGRDFNTVEGVAEIPAGEDFVEISVPLLNNDIVQGDHSFTVLITSVHPIAKSQASGVITDDDTSEISIADASGDESNELVEFTVSLTSAVDSDIQFSFHTAGADEDITPVNLGDATGEVTINSGRTEATFQVVVINDNIQEDDESFTVTASGLTIMDLGISANKVSWLRNEAQGTIHDEEHATVSIAAAVSVDEAVDGPYLFAVSLSHVIRAENEVLFEIVSGSADSGTDFQLPRASNIKFSTRTDVPPQVNVLLEINDDEVAEGDETFEVKLTRSTGKLFLGDVTTSVVTIVDDDFATLSIADATGRETEGTMDFVVTLSHEVKGAVEIRAETLNARDGSRALGAAEETPQIASGPGGFMIVQPDYKIASYTAQVTKGNRNLIQVALFDDTEQECDEAFDVRIAALTCGGDVDCKRVTIADDSATGVLVDDDEGLTLKGSILEHPENEALFDFDIKLSHAVSVSFEAEISLLPTIHTASRLSACAGLTLTACQLATTKSFTIAASQPSGFIAGLNTWSTNFAVDVIDDKVAQPPETFQVAIATTWQAQCGQLTIQNGQGTIVDNEAASVSIQSLAAAEDGDHNMRVTLSHPIDQELIIGFQVSGSGDLSTDFTSTTGEVVFSASVNSQNAFASVDVLAETEESEADEKYTVTLTNVPAWLQNNGPATLTVLDDELELAVIKVNEPRTTEGGNLEYTISLVGDHEEAVVVLWQTVDAGSATAGINFANSNGDLFWSVGDNSDRTVVIETVDVAGCNSDKTVHLQLFGVQGGGVLDNRQSTMESAGTITDKDGATVSLSAPSFVLSSEELAVSAALSATCDADVNVPVVISEGGNQIQTDCTILVGTTKCQVGTIFGKPTTFTAQIGNGFASANPGFTTLQSSKAAVSGQVADQVTGPAPVADRAGCSRGALRSDKIVLMADPDFAQYHSAASCFTGEGLSYSVSGYDGASISPEGLLTIVPSSALGVFNLVVTASGAGGAVSLTYEVDVVSTVGLDVINLAKEAIGVEMNVGDYFQGLMTRVVWSPGNTIDMCANTNLEGRTLTDCCNATPDGLKMETCERNPATRRQVRLESVKVSLKAEQTGQYSFCLGNVPALTDQDTQRYCINIVVN
jgi:hypothetical protein